MRNASQVLTLLPLAPNGQGFMIRSYDHYGVLILVYGIRQGTDIGYIDGIFLDSRLVKRVKVVRDPSGLLYGNGSAERRSIL